MQLGRGGLAPFGVLVMLVGGGVEKMRAYLVPCQREMFVSLQRGGHCNVCLERVVYEGLGLNRKKTK